MESNKIETLDDLFGALEKNMDLKRGEDLLLKE